ncbi:sensor histidine kinase [Microlunatus parietis]|uniref:Oxygen sensor histidine kinase NreB n=1 Tax=Microlunatus parietis TaxID=682979 RepID=A0A7Y9LDM9_9ACTN|nr:sensor histidine kinase [Microlunatus parietis]NYE74072.1 signal transduction histidine kinase [Microlunatus parietis]
MAGSTPAPGGDASPAGDLATAAAGDVRRLALVIHIAFFVLLGAALFRFAQRHGDDAQAAVVYAMAAALAVLYGLALSRLLGAGVARLIWLCGVVGVWSVLVNLAPSFAWCAVPLFFLALRMLPLRLALVMIILFTGLVIFAQLRLAGRFDLDWVVGPPAVAALATAVFVVMDRQATRQAALIEDLVRTRAELAATERREGTLAERQRLSMEIHDTIAQGLSSQRMLLQAADRFWDAEPARAREHVRTAAAVADRGLAEARRFVHDLAPADLAEGGDLQTALRALADREITDERTVICQVDGTPVPLPDRVQSALLRVAQGALANVREHSGATRAAVTVSYLGDEVRLDIADDGRGFDPASPGPGSADRGHGLPAMRARVGQLGGTLTVESAPGDGTVVSAAVPATLEVPTP